MCQEVPSVVERSSICDSCRKELAKFDPEQLGSNDDTDSPPVSPPTSKSEEFCTDRHSLPSETTDLVTHFHESDDVSRIMPRTLCQWEVANVHIRMQKWLVLCNLKEAHQHFKDTYLDVAIGFSKFAELRPKHCVLLGQVALIPSVFVQFTKTWSFL